MKRVLFAAVLALALPGWAWAGVDFKSPNALVNPTITGPVTLQETLAADLSAQTCAGWGLATPVGAWSCTDDPLTITRTASGSGLTLTYNGTQTVVPGTAYEIVATHTITAGSFSSTIGGRVGATYSTTATMHEYFPAGTNGKHIITAVAASAGTITGISVNAITNTISASEGPVVTTAALSSTGNQSGAVDIVTGTKSAGTMSVRDFVDAGSGGTRYMWRAFSAETEKASLTSAGALTLASSVTATTGAFSGAVTGTRQMQIDTAASVTISSQSGCKGWTYYNGDADAINYELSASAAQGLSCCFSANGFAQVVTVDPAASAVIYLDGTALAAGNAIDSAGGAGDFICLESTATNKWITTMRSGTWVDGGAD